MKVGDLVKFKDNCKAGVIVEISEPTPILPYQILEVKKVVTKSAKIIDQKVNYNILAGESLWIIASKIYNDPYAWAILYHDNRETIGDPNKLSLNQNLVIRSDILYIEE